MQKIYESPLNGCGESAERVHVYALDNEEEFNEIDDMDFEERCRLCNVSEEYNVPPGAMYHRYEFILTGDHLVMVETVALNV